MLVNAIIEITKDVKVRFMYHKKKSNFDAVFPFALLNVSIYSNTFRYYRANNLNCYICAHVSFHSNLSLTSCFV